MRIIYKIIVISGIINSFLFSQFQSLSVQKLSDLDFGYIFAGEDKLVNFTDITAASFKISAKTNRISILYFRFMLPNYLYNIINPGQRIPITFSSENASYTYRSFNVLFNPYSTISLLLRRGNNTVNIYLGGYLRSHSENEIGDYRANIILLVDMDDLIIDPPIEPPIE